MSDAQLFWANSIRADERARIREGAVERVLKAINKDLYGFDVLDHDDAVACVDAVLGVKP